MDTRFRFTRDSAVLLAVNRVKRATYREFVNVDGLADEIPQLYKAGRYEEGVGAWRHAGDHQRSSLCRCQWRRAQRLGSQHPGALRRPYRHGSRGHAGGRHARRPHRACTSSRSPQRPRSSHSAAKTRWPRYLGKGCRPPRHCSARGLPSPQAGSPRSRRPRQTANVCAPSRTSASINCVRVPILWMIIGAPVLSPSPPVARARAAGRCW